MPVDPPSDKCPGCAGTGEVDGEFHLPCFGTGWVASIGHRVFLRDLRRDLRIFLHNFKSDTDDKLADIKEKVDEIKDVVDEIKTIIEAL